MVEGLTALLEPRNPDDRRSMGDWAWAAKVWDSKGTLVLMVYTDALADILRTVDGFAAGRPLTWLNPADKN